MKFSLPGRKPELSKQLQENTDGKEASLRKSALWVFLTGTALLVLLALVFFLICIDYIKTGSDQQVNLTANNFANYFDTILQRHGATMEMIVRDRDVIRMLSENDVVAQRAKEQELGYLFPDSIGVRLLRPGIIDVDLESSPPLSYATIAMLRDSETKEKPPLAEVHMFGSPQQHINMVRPVLSATGRKIVGNLLVSLQVPGLQKELDAPRFESGYIELRQLTTKGSALVLASRGDPDLKKGAPAVMPRIKDSRWQLAYWPARAEYDFADRARLWMMVSLGVAIAIFAAVVFLVTRGLSRAIRRDEITFITLVKDMRDNRVKQKYPSSTTELGDTIDLMTRIAGSGVLAEPAAEREQDLERKSSEQDAQEPQSMLESDLTLSGNLRDAEGTGASVVSPAIFRAYDIRGIVQENLTPDVVYMIGRAIGSEASERGQQAVVVGRDGRLSGPELAESLIRGLRSAGRDVKDIGCVPTPVLYFATHYLDSNSGVEVTGSHNPPDYNGLKIVLAGETLSGKSIQRLRQRIEKNEFLSGDGTHEIVDVLPDYIERIRGDINIARPLKVVIDCGNGVAGAVAPRLLRSIGCEVVELFCEVDGNFPNHHPDPSKAGNLATLISAVQKEGADIGLAYDGDGDRMGVIASDGEIIWPDRVMMLLAMDVLTRNPGAQIIYDVKCTKHLADIIRQHGGEPLMWKTGHSLIKAKLKETGALLAGEMSGHIFFRERWLGFDDALYSSARLLEILSNDHRTSSEIFSALPNSLNTPELNVPMAEGEPQRFMESLLASAHFIGAKITTIDGLRADFEDGWGLVRASNTTPVLVLRFEADNEAALRRIQDEFRRIILQVDSTLSLPF